ncbi:hypothetical protein [Halococcus thailandensis]|nr:hypothetical protein [Halococcus thailandensis]
MDETITWLRNRAQHQGRNNITTDGTSRYAAISEEFVQTVIDRKMHDD